MQPKGSFPWRRRRRIGAVAVGLVLVAVACSDKKDEDAVGNTAAPAGASAPATAGASAASSPSTAPGSAVGGEGATTTATGSTAAGSTAGGGTEAPTPSSTGVREVAVQSTLPAPEGDPVMGGRLVVAGEAEVGAPWTPANVQCDAYCYVRIRTFIEPLFVVNRDLEVEGWLAESIEPNEDSTEFTINLRPNITFTDGTPLDADAVIDNLNRTWTGLLVQGAMRDMAKNPDGTVMAEKVDDLTLKLFTGKNGDINQPVKWYQLPYFLTAQPAFMASPTWLAAVDANPDLATQPVGTGPFTVESYLPGDRMTVQRNPNYWRTDPDGSPLPYLDEIEFRVIQDSQVRSQALQSGDVDLIATSDANVVGQYVDDDAFTMVQQNVRSETNYVMFHLTQPQFRDRDIRCALAQAVDKQALIDAVYAGFSAPANGPFSPGQDGYLEDNGSPDFDPDAARETIEQWEAANGPLTFTYSTIPTGTTKAVADFLQQAWGDVGVDVTQNVAEQSQFITQALLGDPSFFAFGWRNHAGLWADTQNHWWHGFGADAQGSEVADGAPNLNFGRLNDPVINDLLDKAREAEDPADRTAIAQDINREFGEQCWILPTSFTTWGIIMDPAVQNLTRESTPDGGTAVEGAGQFWLDSVWVDG